MYFLTPNKTSNMEERVYYVYRHLRNDTGKPFYIGRGKKRNNRPWVSAEYERAFSKKGRSDYWYNIANKHGFEVEIMVDDLTFEECVDKEIELIKLYGKSKNGGLLCNLSDGGEGNKNVVISDVVKKKLRDFNLIPLQHYLDNEVWPEPNTGCWLWTGKVDKRFNSAILNLDTKSSLAAHKVIFEHFKNQTVPKGKMLYRTCNNKLCVNPDHCYISSHKGVQAKGSIRWWRQHLQKLDEFIVREIRGLIASGKSSREIGKLLNVSRSCIDNIKRRKTWRWVNG